MKKEFATNSLNHFKKAIIIIFSFLLENEKMKLNL